MDLHQFFFGLIGVYLFIGLPWQIWRDWQGQRRRSGRCEGTVVGYEWRHGTSAQRGEFHAQVQVPQVEFVVNGFTYICDAGNTATWKVYSLGKRLPVAYNPNDPNDANTIHSWSKVALYPIGMAVSAAAGLAVLVVVLMI